MPDAVLELWVAGNEKVSTQLVITAREEVLEDVSVRLTGDLQGPGGKTLDSGTRSVAPGSLHFRRRRPRSCRQDLAPKAPRTDSPQYQSMARPIASAIGKLYGARESQSACLDKGIYPRALPTGIVPGNIAS